MKMHAKEIIKNKADKMVDLIIDEIGTEGHKKLSASFVDKKTNIKYIIKLGIESGAPDSLVEQIDEEDIPAKISDIMTRLVALEIKEDNDTVYDDTDVLARINALEAKSDYDDSGLKARVTVVENRCDDLTERVTDVENHYDDLTDRVTTLEEGNNP